MEVSRRKLVCNLAALIVLVALAYPTLSFGKPEVSLTGLNYTRVRENAEIISSFGPRMTGYPGYQKTLEFIYSRLSKELGLKVINHTYKVLVPLEEEAYIEVLEPAYLRVKVHALYPNGVNPSATPPEGLEGPLHYVGKGELSDFNGKNIEGSIVAMEFNSQDNWLNAAKLGAKAVIFVEPVSTTYHECYKKFLETPLNFPRVYISRDNWKLIEGASRVRLVSRMTWKEVEAVNIIAVINGSSASDVVILATHFDSWSVVPALSTSKAEAIAPAYLLELARYLKENRPRYTVWLVFLSGHWQALAGARAFVEDYFFSEEVLSGRTTIWGFIGFDMLSSDSDGIQMLQSSYFTTYGGNPIHSGGFPARLAWISNRVQAILAEEPLRTYTNSVLGAPPSALVSMFFSYVGFWGTEPIPYMLDSEAASISGVPSFSITSRHSSRIYVGVPVDDGRYANVSALKPYLEVATYIVLGLLNSEWQISKSLIRPTRYDLAAERGYPGFTTLYGRVMRYNFSAGWYSPVPNAIVEVQLVTSTYKLSKVITRADEEGRFVIRGIPHSGRVAGGGTAVPFSRWIARGWVFDDKGAILMATDLGQFGMQNFAQVINVLHEYENLTVVVAPATVMELFDVNLPSTLLTPSMPDPRTGYFGWWRQAPVILQPYDLLSKSLPLSYGYFCNGWENVALVWAQPGVRFVVVGYTSAAGTAALQQFLLLTNSTSENTEGYGFIGSPGESIRVAFTAYRVASDMYYVSSGRYKYFVDRHVGSPSADLTLSKAREHLDKAREAFSAGLYHEAYAHALVARAYASKAYSSEVMPLVNDAARSMLYMFPLIAFAAFFLEKISLHSEGVKRVAAMTALAAAILWFFLLIHPAFAILSNIALGLVGSLITIILLITIIMLGSEGETLRSRIERRILGVHRSEVSRVDTTITAFSMGSEYIRKRPMRTALMLVTIVAMTIAITSFTSLMPARITLPVPRYGYAPSIDQILLKQGRGVPPDTLSTDLVTVAMAMAGPGYEVLPRAWIYPPVDRVYMALVFPVVSEKGRNATVNAILGITSREYELLYRNVADGAGIFLDEGNYAVVSKYLAQNLSVSIGDRIHLLGEEFVVTGIIDTPEFVDRMLEADGYSPTPTDPIYFSQLAPDIAVSLQAGASPPNLGISRLIIVPYRKALELNGYVASIALIPKGAATSDSLLTTVRELAFAIDIPLYFSHSGSAYVSSTFTSLAVGGWEMVIAVMVIGALNVAVMMLGNLKERTREVFILSAVGLSPLGITVFFIAEVLVYVIVGVVLGYLLGYGMTQLMILAGALPLEHIFNFASAFTVVGTLAIMGASLAAVLYPSTLAAKIITPSLERKWKPPTKPRGNRWEIPLPVSVPSEEEVRGMLAYLYEYYSGAGAVKEGVHVVRELEAPDYASRRLSMKVALSPVEAGVQQSVELASLLDKSVKRHVFLVTLTRLSGSESLWVSSNYKFMDDMRKQLLMWSSLPPAERKRYISIAAR